MEDSEGAHDFDGSELDTETPTLHDKFATQLSLSSSNGELMNVKGSVTSPEPDKEDPSDILHLPLQSLKLDANKKEVIKWRLEKNGFPLVLSDSELYADSSFDSSVSEQSSVTSSPSMSFTVNSDTRSGDFDRADIWVSSLNLDEEDSALLPDKEQILDIFSSNFPSPSFGAMRSLQLSPSNYSPRISQWEETSDAEDPIFWPFERTSYDSTEFDKFLSVSPRQNNLGIRCAEVRKLNPVLQRLQKNKLSSAIQSIEPHRSSINLGSKGTKVVQDKILMPGTVPTRPPHLTIGAPRKVTTPQLQADQPLCQQTKGGNIRKLEDKKSPIEEFIGLDEFDGHVGISSDLANYQFGLWLSPR
ncbi:hypothetical protein EJB05_02919 [Eragrostis curvula]|uniref:Uncharacterized protein n=1 Tax=Eragrostis curvula TaxID=38414 RepID=A0A5J9WUC0_9POAL|nr:hypothetical protein EJB05_02919 [Eragrostis curvula]